MPGSVPGTGRCSREKIKCPEGRRRRDDRGRDGWMASPMQWTWVSAGSGRWWWTGKPGVLQSMGSHRVGHSWVTALSNTLTAYSLMEEITQWYIHPFNKFLECIYLHKHSHQCWKYSDEQDKVPTSVSFYMKNLMTSTKKSTRLSGVKKLAEEQYTKSIVFLLFLLLLFSH